MEEKNDTEKAIEGLNTILERLESNIEEFSKKLFDLNSREEAMNLAIEWASLCSDVEEGKNLKERISKIPGGFDLLIATMYASSARYSMEKGNWPKAITLLSMADRAMFGCIRLTQEAGRVSKRASENARKAHLENNAIKADALKYYIENIERFKSKDAAAEQIAGKIVTSKFRTVRQWITEYHKNLRSAGTT